MVNSEIIQASIDPIQDALAGQGARAKCRRFCMDDEVVGRVVFAEKLLALRLIDRFSPCPIVNTGGRIT